MKILHVTQNYHPSVGGTQHMIKKISEYFSKIYGDEVTVLTSNSLYGPNRQEFEKINVKHENINGVAVTRFPFVKTHIPLIKLVARFLRRAFNQPLPNFLTALLSGPISPGMLKTIVTSDADVIGVSSIHYLFASYPLWRRFTSKQKPFVVYGALHLHKHKLLKLYKRRAKAADFYIANTNFEKEYLVNVGIDSENIRVIGAGSNIISSADFSVTDKALKNKYNIENGSLIITYIGRQEILKGILVLINAFTSLQKASITNISLFLCGAKAADTDYIKSLISQNSSIRLYSNITELEKTEILRVTDILVLPSKEESFGIVFLEAWAFSKPVIGAKIGAVASLIEEGKDGLLFEPDDTESLANKIKQLVESEPLRVELGNNGNKKFLENFTWDIIAKKFRDVYQEAMVKFTEQSRKVKI